MTTILKQLLKIYYEENIESFSLCLMVADTMQAGETRSVFPKAITVMTPGVIVERGHWRSLGVRGQTLPTQVVTGLISR